MAAMDQTSGGTMLSTGEGDLWVDRRGEGPEVLFIAGLGDPAEAWQAQLDGLADRYTPDGVRQPRRGTVAARRPAALRGLDGRRCGESPARARGLGGACCRVFDGERHRAGAGPAASGARAEPGAREHVRPRGRPLPLPARVLALAPRGGADRARLLRGVLHLGLHAPGARRRLGGPDRRGGVGLPPQGAARGRFRRRWTCAARTTRPTASWRSTFRPSCWPVSRTSSCRLAWARRRRADPRRPFEVMEEQAHQPFQEIPDEWNARVDAFWREVGLRLRRTEEKPR